MQELVGFVLSLLVLCFQLLRLIFVCLNLQPYGYPVVFNMCYINKVDDDDDDCNDYDDSDDVIPTHALYLFYFPFLCVYQAPLIRPCVCACMYVHVNQPLTDGGGCELHQVYCDDELSEQVFPHQHVVSSS